MEIFNIISYLNTRKLNRGEEMITEDIINRSQIMGHRFLITSERGKIYQMIKMLI